MEQKPAEGGKPEAWAMRLTFTQVRIIGGLLITGLPAYLGYQAVKTKQTATDLPDVAEMSRRLTEAEKTIAKQEIAITKAQNEVTDLHYRVKNLEHAAGYDSDGNYYQAKPGK